MVVIGGQTLSLALTLVVIPVTYALLDDAAEMVRNWRGVGRREAARETVAAS